LKDREAEISCFRASISDMETYVAVYIPVKNDLVDKRLAEFINISSEKAKLAVMFRRENDDGIY
jgi:hypothetical protein